MFLSISPLTLSNGNMSLSTIPLDFEKAAKFIEDVHRHHPKPVGHKFSIGAVQSEDIVNGILVGVLVGVVIVGRPVSRMRDDGMTLEVTRLATDGTRNACSFLYGAAARATFALGYRRIGTYILKSEPGTSLKAAGWKLIGERGGGSWIRAHDIRRATTKADRFPTEQKLLFELTI